MKTLFFILISIFTLLSCSKSDENNTVPTTSALVGKWKLIERKNSDGGSTPEWVSISNGFVLTINSNNTYSTTESLDCNSGIYSVHNNAITFTNSCGNSTIPNKFNLVSQTSKELILSNINCIEECKDKFQKIE